MDTSRIIDDIAARSRERFESAASIMSFADFLDLLAKHPYRLTRSAAQYTADMMDHFGTEEVSGIGGPATRYKVFDDPTGSGEFKVIGQEEVQEALHRTLREFVHRRRIDKMILLHGPNGSAKTSIVAALMRGLEAYSRTDEGILLRFNWIFSEGADRGERLGFDPARPEQQLDSYARLEPEHVSAKIPCELRDSPLFLVPTEERAGLLESLLDAVPQEKERFVWTRFLLEGDLSPKAKKIYDSLLKAHGGDWKDVMRYVQVERYHVSRRYRSAAVTIEPQGNIDAGSRELGHSVMTGLPPVLLNEAIHEAQGDLIDANCGIVEYSDFLKRPIEANKYLLTTAESGVISLPSYTARVNLLLIGTSNENYLAAFKRDPLFSSFKSRLELIRVPYLLEYEKEEEIYERHLAKLPEHIKLAPHTCRIAAMWAVMTRLMAPTGNVGEDGLQRIIATMTPLQKANLYNSGETPPGLSDEEANGLRRHAATIRGEYDALEAEFEGAIDAAYEGRRGCSPREMLALLSEITVSPPGDVVTPLLVLRSLPELTRDPGLYDFLRLQRTKQGYHDIPGFLVELENEYYRMVRDDVQEAAELVEEAEYTKLFSRYFQHVKAYGTGEKVLDESTGRSADPDGPFMHRVEELLAVEGDPDHFRSNLMTRVAAAKLAAPDQPIDVESVFTASLRTLKESLMAERMSKVSGLVERALVTMDVRPGKLDEDQVADAERFVERMGTIGYGEYAMVEALEFFLAKASDLG